MRTTHSWAAAIMAAALLSACGEKPEPAVAPPDAAPATQAAAPAPAAPAESGVQVAEGDFGVPECDRFLEKYFECVNSKVPEAARPALLQSIEMTKQGWKQAASTPAGKSGLASGCQQAEAQMKTQMSAYNCTW